MTGSGRILVLGCWIILFICFCDWANIGDAVGQAVVQAIGRIDFGNTLQAIRGAIGN